MSSSAFQTVPLPADNLLDRRICQALHMTPLLRELDDCVIHRLAPISQIVFAPDGEQLSEQGEYRRNSLSSSTAC